MVTNWPDAVIACTIVVTIGVVMIAGYYFDRD